MNSNVELPFFYENIPIFGAKFTEFCLSQVELWKKYITFEKSNPLRSEDTALVTRRVMFATEQCLLVLNHHPAVWHQAAQYLDQCSKLLTDKGVRILCVLCLYWPLSRIPSECHANAVRSNVVVVVVMWYLVFDSWRQCKFSVDDMLNDHLWPNYNVDDEQEMYPKLFAEENQLCRVIYFERNPIVEMNTSCKVFPLYFRNELSANKENWRKFHEMIVFSIESK